MPSLKPSLLGVCTLLSVVSGTGIIVSKCNSGNNATAKAIIKENKGIIKKSCNLTPQDVDKFNKRIDGTSPLVKRCVLSQKIVDSLQAACDTLKKVKI